jgi:hypothetical protein
MKQSFGLQAGQSLDLIALRADNQRFARHTSRWFGLKSPLQSNHPPFSVVLAYHRPHRVADGTGK